MLRSSVDFPAPEKPTMPWMVPRLMCRLTSSTAVNRPPGESKEVLTFWISITDGPLFASLALPWSAWSWIPPGSPKESLAARGQAAAITA